VIIIFFFIKSLCWPCANKGLGAWVTDSQRNTIFGYFGTCPFVGGILGTALAVHLQESLGWREVHIYPSIFCVS
jgi:sugar phosphate permease